MSFNSNSEQPQPSHKYFAELMGVQSPEYQPSRVLSKQQRTGKYKLKMRIRIFSDTDKLFPDMLINKNVWLCKKKSLTVSADSHNFILLREQNYREAHKRKYKDVLLSSNEQFSVQRYIDLGGFFSSTFWHINLLDRKTPNIIKAFGNTLSKILVNDQLRILQIHPQSVKCYFEQLNKGKHTCSVAGRQFLLLTSEAMYKRYLHKRKVGYTRALKVKQHNERLKRLSKGATLQKKQRMSVFRDALRKKFKEDLQLVI